MLYLLVLQFNFFDFTLQMHGFLSGLKDVKNIDVVNERDINQIKQKGPEELVAPEFSTLEVHGNKLRRNWSGFQQQRTLF
jgi:hypothetical protein